MWSSVYKLNVVNQTYTNDAVVYLLNAVICKKTKTTIEKVQSIITAEKIKNLFMWS